MTGADRACELCDAARITEWHHEDETCWVADCEVCGVPMVVWKHHGHEPPEADVDHNYRVNGVRLQVDVLDSAGEVENRVFGWVPGDVPAGGRAYFFVSVPKRGASYRVKVLSFFLVSREMQ